MAVVTRYYGGIKLGVRGLINAYRDSTLAAIGSVNIIVAEPMSTVKFSCSYELYNFFLSRLQKNSIDCSKMRADFTDIISGEIQIPKSALPLLTEDLDSISHSGEVFTYTVSGNEG
jgi:putative IMPACT (imprinted ancient) family translation regulator